MRSPVTLLLLISCSFIKFAHSQSRELVVEGATGKLFLTHHVVAKENWYSVGRLYNVSPKELALFNSLTMSQPLQIGQALEVPLTAVNFSQDDKKDASETLIPVFYVIKEKEWLYRVSANHNKVPIPDLQKWNNLASGGDVHAGQHLIVGYLKVKTALSAFAGGTLPPGTGSAGDGSAASNQAAAAKPAAGTKTKSNDDDDGEYTDNGAAKTGAGAAKTESSKTDAGTAKTGAPVTKPEATTPAVTKPVAKADIPAAATTSVPIKTETAPVPKTESAPASTKGDPATSKADATVSKPITSTPGPGPAPHFNGGAFRGEYSTSGKSAPGLAGIFKSTSGWQDGKYYALMNNVAVGTIVKVTDGASGKSVFVKVLGQLPDMKESVGLTIRISNAAAAELGEGDGKFSVSVSY